MGRDGLDKIFYYRLDILMPFSENLQIFYTQKSVLHYLCIVFQKERPFLAV